ncbi:hypothetical protein BKA64DRAFT_248112 [Cadophora sp. MPI-SDFR-AT-0126]|nr:hypothetical protein BKA64DRAFT_248112 [Leotiomycetes sp. MPI-SDFR-AT-0126]
MASSQHFASVRATQRAPRSCVTCARRRVKCEKKIPCRECINRGIEASCKRETVKVKGKILVNVERSPSQETQPSYQALLEENERFKAQLARPAISLPTNDRSTGVVRNITESFERDLFETAKLLTRKSTVSSESDIIWPSPECAASVISFGKLWTSWIHCAIHHPTFEKECDSFWRLGYHSSVNEVENRLWLSVYFGILSSALLFMDEAEALESGIAAGDIRLRLLHWYDASLFYLHKGDFLRNHSLRSVQAIAILGIVFNNVGDSDLHYSLWGCAIRIAQALKMGLDRENPDEDPVQQQVRRRLWWTIVLCEWLPVPYRTPCILEADFKTELPASLQDHEYLTGRRDGIPQPNLIDYHIAMSQVAIHYHRFRFALRHSKGSLEDIFPLVISADEALASFIDQLPEHLRPEEPDQKLIHSNNKDPWMSWQRGNLSVVFMYYRIVINRVLQDQWIHDPSTFARTRSICLSSARGIIEMTKAYARPIERHRPWPISSHLFSAAIVLLVEVRFHPSDAHDHYMSDIKSCVDFLDEIKDQSTVASRAAEILRQQIRDYELEAS